ncbi:hypothetical protein HDV05_001013, partial [Chytridiales sp. JEL 0842]
MVKKTKSFIDKTKAVSFQVVYRSQRDPAMADETASKMVLRPIPQSMNLVKKGKAESIPEVDYDYEEMSDDYDEQQHDSEFDEDEESGEWDDDEEEEGGEDGQGQEGSCVDADQKKSASSKGKRIEEPIEVKEDAAMHGIYFKDEYDYLKHLKPIGEDPSAVFLAASNAPKPATKANQGIRFVDDTASVAMSETPKRKGVKFDIPSEVLPSEYEEKVGLLNRGPDVNILEVEPSMREVIYALDDDAYVEEDLDDFFEALDAEEVPEELLEALVPDGAIPPGVGGMAGRGEEDDEEYDDFDENDGWMEEFKRYKAQSANSDDEYDDDEDPRMAGYDAKTNFSMTSSALFRNKHLTFLDERFDKVLEDYDDENLGELDSDDPEVRGGGDTIAQQQIDQIFD